MTNNGTLLWVDDEIELLRAHILFLEKKGYEVITVSNGTDAVEQCQKRAFDLVLLDEMMPGISGLEVLQLIKEAQPQTPVVMVTKSEEEDIMNQAIGSKIADYLIKPVNPSQILLSLKKNIHQREIVTSVTESTYQQSFADISREIDNARTAEDWKNIYKRLVHWELELVSLGGAMGDLLLSQKEEADKGFAKYVKNNYLSWVKEPLPTPQKGNLRAQKMALRSGLYRQTEDKGQQERPLLSNQVFKQKVLPALDRGEKVFLLVMDNFRYDQWRILQEEIGDRFTVEEDLYFSILPTATQYARNAIFSGLMPNKIAELFPELWVDEDEEEGKNLNEEPLIGTQMRRFQRKETFSYAKVNDSMALERYLQQFEALRKNDLNVLVVNFIDMLSHARTESRMVRELANNEAAYRSITLSWFRHSALSLLFERLEDSGFTVMITTDHGSIRVQRPVKIVGDRNTNTNLRYKLGKNLNFSSKEVFVIKDPKEALLPAPNLSTAYVFATGDTFFAYPNNYNYYASFYKDTFQHGGISMEEMIVPFVVMKKRKR